MLGREVHHWEGCLALPTTLCTHRPAESSLASYTGRRPRGRVSGHLIVTVRLRAHPPPRCGEAPGGRGGGKRQASNPGGRGALWWHARYDGVTPAHPLPERQARTSCMDRFPRAGASPGRSSGNEQTILVSTASSRYSPGWFGGSIAFGSWHSIATPRRTAHFARAFLFAPLQHSITAIHAL